VILKEAGRCLAFDLPTACAFHICRATEALMLTYYEALTGNAWPFPRLFGRPTTINSGYPARRQQSQIGLERFAAIETLMPIPRSPFP